MVLFTVPLVAVAVTLALFLQMGQPIVMSMLTGGLVGGLLIALHSVHRRGQSIAALRDEITRLNALRVQQPATAGASRPQRADAMATGSPQSQPAQTSPASQPSRAAAQISETPAKTASSNTRPAESAGAPSGEQPAAVSAAPPPPSAPVRAAQSNLPPPLPPQASVVGTVQDATAPAIPPPPPAKSAGTAAPARNQVPPPVMPPLLISLPSPSGGPGQPISSYWDLRPGAVRDLILPLDQAGDKSKKESPPQGAMAGSSSTPASTGPASNPDWPIAKSTTSEQELAVMQTLIEQLAIQLNEPKSAQSNKATAGATASEPATKLQTDPSLTRVEQSIEASLSALKVTAETMRKPPVIETEATSGEPTGHKAASTQAAPPIPELPAVQEPKAARKSQNSSSYSRLAELTEAIAAERIEVFLDPIHGLGDRKARHFEVAIRLQSLDGDSLSASDYLSIATGTGLLARIDQAKLTRTARVADRLHARGTSASLFSSLSGESLTDDSFLDTFEAVLGEQETLPNRLVLTFAQADARHFTDAQWDAILTMAEIGVRFALDGVTDLDMDFSGLKAHGFGYVKLDASVFLDGLPTPDGPIASADICRHLANEGLTVIVGQIEDELTMAKLLGFGVLFGQGTLFGGARPVKVEIGPAPSVVAA